MCAKFAPENFSTLGGHHCSGRMPFKKNVCSEKGISPGNYRIYPAKHFGDFWTLKMKKALGLPAQYKFYSLKDTGITGLIRSNTDLLSVRDQARHHSLQMTDLYTPLESRVANESIRHHESYF